MNWKLLEDKVRALASAKWGRPAVSQMINNVHFDCVVEINDRHWIVVEVSKSATIEKLRIDLAKFSSIDGFLWNKRIHTEFFFVSEKSLSDEFRGTAKGNNVTAFNFEEFEVYVLDYKRYSHARRLAGFGSAIDPDTGEPDKKDYIKVSYKNSKTNEDLSLSDLLEILNQGRSVVLTGDYGTGKSRLIKELFEEAAEKFPNTLAYPVAIDLRGCWGVKRGTELIRRHFEDLGLSEMSDQIIKIMPYGRVTWLFDGFDELGVQAWTSDRQKIQEIRRGSLSPIRELLKTKKNNFIITGRSHYFNSDDEMLDCFGIKREDIVIINCKEEFTQDEFRQYFNNDSYAFPDWLPKRPLIAYMLGSLNPEELEKYTHRDSTSESDFWDIFFPMLGQRESGINSSLDSTVVCNVLKSLSRSCRSKNMPYGPISASDISSAFVKSAGVAPDASSMQMLQRLPCLGRFGSSSDERMFVDEYVLDGLRGEDLADIISNNDITHDDRGWKHPIGRFGIRIAIHKFSKNSSEGLILPYLRGRTRTYLDGILNGDVLSMLLATDHSGPINCKICNTHIIELNLAEKEIKGLDIEQSLIDTAYVGGESLTDSSVYECHISSVIGVGSRMQISAWLHDSTTVDKFDEISNSTSILSTNLTNAQKILLVLIQRLFFQPGAGRKERALLRGLGEFKDAKISKEIIRFMKSEGIISEHQGDEGTVYRPNRKYKGKMGDIRDSKISSIDPLWKLACSLE